MTEAASPSVIEWERVSFAYGDVAAIQDVSLCIHYGELAAVMGPNGSGKSTLIKLALGLLQPDAGRVRLFGRDVNDFDQWGRVGYMPQVVNGAWQDFPATVSEVVSLGTYSGVSPLGFFRRSERADVLAAIETVGMTAYRSRRLAELSVGQQQRVLLARAPRAESRTCWCWTNRQPVSTFPARSNCTPSCAT